MIASANNFFHLFRSDPNQPRCYGVYGCFPIEYPWKSEQRLVSLYPESPIKIEPRYPVFTRRNRMLPNFLDLNDPEATRDAGIDPTGNIYIIVHGFIESGDRPWVIFFKYVCNVIFQYIQMLNYFRSKTW